MRKGRGESKGNRRGGVVANNVLLGYRKRRTSNAHTGSIVPSSIEIWGSPFPSYYTTRSALSLVETPPFL